MHTLIPSLPPFIDDAPPRMAVSPRTGNVESDCDTDPVRVLVVEDEVRLSAALKRGLEAEGFTVDVAANGSDGLWLATEQPYDAIMLDIMLPGINGLKVCQTLREKQVWTPVLILTAKDGELDEAEALEIGADDFLSKPFSYTVLIARLRALIRRGAAARPTVLTGAGIVLDPAARTCTIDGALVELTGREFAVLEYLLHRIGEVVPKNEILQHVWDFAYEGGDNVVEVHISALRRKLGASAIETVRGSGYRVSDHPNRNRT
jgi:two-component system, OmpR family, response regulator